jgi:hypothetical protein
MNRPIQPSQTDPIDQEENKATSEMMANQTPAIRPVQLDRKQVECKTPVDPDLDDPCSP